MIILDFAKAFNTIEWDFIEVFIFLNFGKYFCYTFKLVQNSAFLMDILIIVVGTLILFKSKAIHDIGTVSTTGIMTEIGRSVGDHKHIHTNYHMGFVSIFLPFYRIIMKYYERNFNFTQPALILPVPNLPSWPDSDGFRQLTKGNQKEMPEITKEHIKTYFEFQQVADKLPLSNTRSIFIGQDHLVGRRIDICSFKVVDTSVFFSGIVRAATRKKVPYRLKLKLNDRGEF